MAVLPRVRTQSVENPRRGRLDRLVEWRRARWKLATNAIGRVLQLPQDCRNDFLIRRPDRRVHGGKVVLDIRVEVWQLVRRNHRKHVVLHVVVHVPVEESVDPAHLDSAAVETVIQSVLLQPRMLRK